MTEMALETAEKRTNLTNIPLVPQYVSNYPVCVSTPDGGLLYIGTRSVNYLGSVQHNNEAPQIKIFRMRQNILAVDVDPAWGQTQNSLPVRNFAILAEDLSLQIWEFSQPHQCIGHKVHTPAGRYVDGGAVRENVLFSFMHNGNVLSLNAQDIVVYCVRSNMYHKLHCFMPSRNQKFTVLRCAPDDENIFAVGTSRGSLLICSLKSQAVVYTLRGHDSAISALSWKIVPTGAAMLEEKEDNKKSAKLLKSKAIDLSKDSASSAINLNDIVPDEDVFDIYDYEYLEHEFGAPATKAVISEDAFIGVEKPSASNNCEQFDYVEACENLKKDINTLNELEEQPKPEELDCAITLEECQEAAAKQDTQSSICNDEDAHHDESASEKSSRTYSDDSLQFIDGTSSSAHQQILHKAEVHTNESKPEKATELEVAEKPLDADNNALQAKQITSSAVLLASGSVDGHISVWNTKLGKANDSFQVRGGNHRLPNKNLTIRVSWCGESGLLINNKNGDAALWMLDERAQPSEHIFKFKENREHPLQAGIFDFAVSQDQKTVWYISVKREIYCKTLGSEQVLAHYCCLPTGIAAMHECMDNLNHIALACSDRRIGIIDTSSLTPTSIHINNYTQRIAAAVTALAWSPDSKKLAFATLEGRVGILNIEKVQTSTPFLYNSVCGNKIYSIFWSEHGIYVVCNNMLAFYENSANNKDAHYIKEAVNATCVTVKGEHVLVGNQDGLVQVLLRQEHKVYQHLTSVPCAKRYISELAFSPVKPSQLAVVSNSADLVVYSFDATQGSLELLHRIDMEIAKAGCATVKWSHLDENLLVTAGMDGAVRVFDLSQQTKLKYLKQYDCPLLCAMFMPSNENVLMVAGRTTSLEFIDMQSEASEDYCLSRYKRGRNSKVNIVWAVKMLHTLAAMKTVGGKKERHMLATKAVKTEDAITHKKDVKTEPEGEVITTLMENLAVDEPVQKQRATLLYLTTKDLNKNAGEHILDVLKKKTSKIPAAKLFGSQKLAKELWEQELKHLKTSTPTCSSLEYSFMGQFNTNDLKTEILSCIQKRTLNEFHVSLAPSVSYQFWQKCCTAFAAQLEEQGYILRAATYLFAFHDQNAVIELLLKHKYFKEALLVAKIYLQADSPEFNKILDNWIEHLLSDGNIPAAALLCTLSQQMNRAHTILSKLQNPTADIKTALALLQAHNQLALH